MFARDTMADSESEYSRRTYIKGAALASTAGMAGLAGCTGGGGGGGSGGNGSGGNGSGGNGSGSGGSGGGSGQALEVLHAWTGGDGKKAINALTRKFKNKYPNMQTDFRPIGGGGNTNLNTVVAKRLGNNNPPSAFAGWPGQNLTQYEGILANANEAWSNYKNKHFQEVVDACKYNGNFVAVPIGSHRLNDLFFNKNVLNQAGVNPNNISDYQGLLSALKTVQQNTNKVPMTQAMKLPFSTLQLFGTVLLSTQGYQAYMNFTNGKGDKQKVVAALKSTKQILANYINDDASSTALTGSLNNIMNGNAAFIHQGNWAAGAFGNKQGFKYGKDWGHITFPGTEGMYTLHMDSFIKPANNPSPQKTTKWLSYVGTKEAQVTFDTRKGSIPTRKDTTAKEFGPYLSNTIKDFKNAKQKPPTIAHGLAVPASTLTNLKGVINDNFTGPYNVEATADAMLQTISDGQA
jgi:glucose/mannose transport system substrate-binding protein